MTVYADVRKLTAERNSLSDEIDETLGLIVELTTHIDPYGHNISRAKQLSAELPDLLDKLQANDHQLWWSQTKQALIDQCIESDRLQ